MSPKPNQIPASTPEVATLIETVRAILKDPNSPVNRFFQFFVGLVREGGNVEAYVPFKKEGGLKPVSETKELPEGSGHWTCKGNGSTPVLMEEAFVAAGAKYFQRSSGILDGPIPEEVTKRCAAIMESLLPGDLRSKLHAEMAHLIAAAPAEQPLTVVRVRTRFKYKNKEVTVKQNVNISDPENVTAFLASLKDGVQAFAVTGKKKSEEKETPLREWLKSFLLAQADEEAAA